MSLSSLINVIVQHKDSAEDVQALLATHAASLRNDEQQVLETLLMQDDWQALCSPQLQALADDYWTSIPTRATT